MPTTPVSRSQPDGSSEPLNKVEKPRPSQTPSDSGLDPADDHIGATEDQVSPTPPPADDDYKDEPKQG